MIASLLKVCMVRRRSAILIFGFALVLAGCGGGVSSTPNSTPVIQSSSDTTSFALSAAVTNTQLTVSEVGYHGTYTASSSNTAIATVSSAMLQSSSNMRSTQATVASAADGSGTFTITAVANGSATIIVNDDQGHSSSFPVTVTGISGPAPSPTASAGPLAVSPAALTFNGTAQTQTVTVTDPGTMSITMSGCSGIATLGALTNGAFTVTSVAAGACTITVSDTFTHQATISVSVTTLGVPIQ